MEVRFNQGVFLPGCELWLDPPRARQRAFIPHARSDHTAWHGQTIATSTTLSILEARMGAAKGRGIPMEFHQPREFSEFRLTLIPTGSVLGSAQAFVEAEGGSLLYTSDFKLRCGISSESAVATRADTLVMETTYGLPKYRFPPAEEVLRQIVRFCAEALEEGKVPVLLGHSLGKFQEILSFLVEADFRIALHRSVWNLTRLYEVACGVQFPAYEKITPREIEGRVLICPPSIRGTRWFSFIARKRVAALTGWAMDSETSHRLQCDAVFPLSDHADYDDLLHHVEAVAPRRVFTLHGFAQEFAHDLRSRGVEAWALTSNNQLEFPVIPAPPARLSFSVRAPCAQLERTGFGRFCLLCEQVTDSTGKSEKIRLLKGFLRKLSDPELSRACVWLTGNAFPRCKECPTQAGGALIRRALIAVSGLSEQEFRAVAGSYNSLSCVAAQVLARQLFHRRVEISDLQAAFMRLHDFREPMAKSKFLEELLASVSALEGKIIIKILTGESLIGFNESLVEESIAAAFAHDPMDLHEANMLLGDIGRAAVLARQNRLESAEPTLFRPVPYMLASMEYDVAHVWERISQNAQFSGSVWVEGKLDGIRVQVHTDGSRSEIYARNLQNITSLFPEIAEAACRLGRPSLLDGELIAGTGERPLGFFDLQENLLQQEKDFFLVSRVPVVFVAFDLLFLDGVSLLRKPLYDRRSALESLEFSEPLRLALPARHFTDLKGIESVFDAACTQGDKGIFVKEPASAYTSGRRSSAWVNLKKQSATLDVVVVGAKYGQRCRNQVLNYLTYALRRADGSLATVGKVYNNLTDTETILLTKHLQATTLCRTSNYHEVRPTVVLEIVFDSVQKSVRYESGLTLRFPRIKRIREDKAPFEVDTLNVAERFLPSRTSKK